MKRFTLSVIILWMAAQSYPLHFAHASAPETLAEGWVTSVRQHAWAQASKNYDAAMQMALPPQALQTMWLQLEQQYGPLESYSVANTFPFAGYTVVDIHCHFPRQSVTARISVDGQNRIGGVQFVPYQPPPAAAAAAANTASIIEESFPLTFTDRGDLSGTLTRPSGNGSGIAVVLVHGSGAHDQDETLGPNKPFKDLAHGLAAQDIAVYRFDKRSLTHPGEFAAENNYTVEDEVIADARAAVTALQPHFQHIFVLGHSLGGTVAPRIAQNTPVAGLIILAGSTRSFEDMLLEQMRTVLFSDGDWSVDDEAAYQTVVSQADVLRSLTPESNLSPAQLPFGIPASYWLDFKAYDPVRTAAALSVPILILQGERDYQVTMEDFNAWRRGLLAFDHVRMKSYPNLNHLFMAGSGPSTPQEYFTQSTVDSTVISDIAAWVKESVGRKK